MTHICRIVDRCYCYVIHRKFFSFLQDCAMYCMSVVSLFHRAESSPFCNWYCLFTLSFLSKRTRLGRNIVSIVFSDLFLFVCDPAKCLLREQCIAALNSSCSLQKYLERWPAALYEAGWSVLMLTFRHRASCILGQAFHYSPENAFYIFNQQIYFIIWYLLDRASLI